MFTKDKLERWINVLNSCGIDLVMKREGSSCLMEKWLAEEKLHDLEELRNTLEKLYTTMDSNNSI